jgi:protease PrsW
MTAVDDGMLDEQREAIRESGWGETFRLWQPHNPAFWVWAVGVAAGLLSFLQQLTSVSQVYVPAVVGGIVTWSLFLIPWIVFLRHKDRYEREPARLATAGFFWGGLAATFAIALPGNDAALGLYSKLVSPTFAATWGPPLTAPVVEESAKACGIVLLILLAPRLVRSAYDGLILGAFVGLGFQTFEDWLYTVQGAAQTLGQNQAWTVAQTFLLRGVFTGLFTHALYSALAGMGIIWLAGRPNEPRRPLLGGALIASAVLGHGLWDAAGTAGLPFLIIVTAAFLLVTIIFAERAAAARSRAWMRALLAPEVVRGTITSRELDALAGSYEDRQSFIKAAHGHASHHQARHVIHAALDLAEEIARGDGQETEAVAFARSEVERVRQA